MGPTYWRTVFPSCLLLLFLLVACDAGRLTEYRLSGPSIGTTFSVVIVTASEFDQEKLERQIHETLDDVDRHMSTYRSDSELAKLNHATSTDWIPVTRRLCLALENAHRLSGASNGAFDITVGPLVDLWGFGPDGSRIEPPSDEAIDEARTRSGRDKLHLDCQRPAIRKDHAGLRIDLSGYAKGLAADEIAALLDANGLENYLVEIGGDLRARGHNSSHAKWRIAIEKPDPADRKVEQVIHVSDLGVATSGDYRNYFEHDGQRYSHTIDPRTGRPVSHALASVTVLGDSAAYADAMATALLVLGPDAGPEFAEREYIAAYFLTRNQNDLQEQESSRFSALTDH